MADLMYRPLFNGNPEQDGGPVSFADPPPMSPPVNDNNSPPPPTSPPTDNNSFSLGGIMDFVNKIFPGVNGTAGFGGINPLMIPYLTTALNQYNNSGKYMDLASKYADQMNPFGSQRQFYQDKLKALETDPNAYLASSPDYQAALKQGLGALDSSLSAKGFGGSGHAADEAQTFGSTLAAQFLDKDRQSLMQMAGANIGPAAAAALISEGMRGSIDSQNQALANLFGAFTKPNPNPGPGTGPLNQGGFTIPGLDKQTSDFVTMAVKSGMSIGDAIKMAGTLKGNFTVNPPSMGGINGTGDGPAGPGGDAPGSEGPQFDWDKYQQDPEGYLASLGMGGSPDGSIWDSGFNAPIDNWDNIGDLGFFD